MKHIFLILATCMLSLSLWAGKHNYADNSVLSEGKIIKISVQTTGIHAITYNELKEWGLQPEKVRVLGYGGNMRPRGAGVLRRPEAAGRQDPVCNPLPRTDGAGGYAPRHRQL